jgi:hypothetical protein
MRCDSLSVAKFSVMDLQALNFNFGKGLTSPSLPIQDCRQRDCNNLSLLGQSVFSTSHWEHPTDKISDGTNFANLLNRSLMAHLRRGFLDSEFRKELYGKPRLLALQELSLLFRDRELQRAEINEIALDINPCKLCDLKSVPHERWQDQLQRSPGGNSYRIATAFCSRKTMCP